MKFSLLNKAKKSIAKKKRSIVRSAKVAGKVAKTVGKGAIKGAKIAGAAGGLVADIANPYKRTKMIVNAVRGKGLVLPGSKYIGPGNAMNLGKGNSSADRAALVHDKEYDALLKKGVGKAKLYGGYSKADERLMKASDVTTKHGLATYGVMGIKKGIYKLGLSGKMTK